MSNQTANSKDSKYWIEKLELKNHPEGGWYRETYRSLLTMEPETLQGTLNTTRNVSTAIYYLLESGQFSAFHRIKSDEMWHFYAGTPLNLYILNKNAGLKIIRLGSDPDKEERFQYWVQAGDWFASEPADENSFSLLGCTVAPGFDFKDFEIANKADLATQFPQHQELIARLCLV